MNTEPEIDAAWADEVERRHAEIEAGTVALLPGAETIARLSAELTDTKIHA
ncbi:MAG: addiction module protein [Burkholderiales bacterium]